MRLATHELPSQIGPFRDSRLGRLGNAIKANPLRVVETVVGTGIAATVAFVVGNGILHNRWGDPLVAPTSDTSGEVIPGESANPIEERLKSHVQEKLAAVAGNYPNLLIKAEVVPSLFGGRRVGRVDTTSQAEPIGQGLVTRSVGIERDPQTALPEGTWLVEGSVVIWSHEVRMRHFDAEGRLVHESRWAVALNPEYPDGIGLNCISETNQERMTRDYILEITPPESVPLLSQDVSR